MDNPQYHPLYQQAIGLQQKFQDFTAGSNHPQARLVQHEIQQLAQEVRTNKNPHDLESRIRIIQNQMHQAQYGEKPLLNYEHHNVLHNNFEHMRMNVRQFHNFQ